MKKKLIICGVIALVAVGCAVYFFTRPMLLGNMNGSYPEPTTKTSAVSFSGEASDRIKFSFRSAVESGELDIILYDSQGNEVYQLDRAKALEAFCSLRQSDTYILAAECSNFIGTYGVAVYRVESGGTGTAPA